MNLRRAVLAAVLSLPLALAGASGSHADGTNIVAPVMDIVMGKITGGTHVCADGSAAAAGTWTVGINGVRSDATQIDYGAGSGGATTTFHVCTDIWKNGTPSGTFYVYFIFQGGTNSTATVRPGSLSGVTAWRPTGDDVHVQTTGG